MLLTMYREITMLPEGHSHKEGQGHFGDALIGS